MYYSMQGCKQLYEGDLTKSETAWFVVQTFFSLFTKNLCIMKACIILNALFYFQVWIDFSEPLWVGQYLTPFSIPYLKTVFWLYLLIFILENGS